MTASSKTEIEPYLTAINGMKAENVVALDVSRLTSIADVFILCEGRSNRQVSAISDHIVKALKDQGIKPLSMEGVSEGRWVLLDYGDVIIHVFYESVRAFYDIEGLWADARRIEV
ncbi:ribosome silencing factor [Desulfosudis oleivorans]|uniref:Ribosomal silencing factor RsfS n=1 Tax=Desulfosudis oleivorans (strain DSM 6200 / JCM 39069 / Hxd3) TaxID=96561 RepID=A8ZRY5_DESOH|nr:ribosome silencing factor [Desulfosudis oleivorans]ABW65902.1 iojap-like protein [Desulfosudis oleivorans Hxd3]